MVVDESEWPLVVTTIRDGFTVDDIDAMHADFERFLSREVPFAAVTDALGLRTLPTREARAAITAWSRENEHRIRRFNVAGATAIDSAIARATLRAIHWLAPHPTPYRVVATVAEARAFCTEELARVRGDAGTSRASANGPTEEQ